MNKTCKYTYLYRENMQLCLLETVSLYTVNYKYKLNKIKIKKVYNVYYITPMYLFKQQDAQIRSHYRN